MLKIKDINEMPERILSDKELKKLTTALYNETSFKKKVTNIPNKALTSPEKKLKQIGWYCSKCKELHNNKEDYSCTCCYNDWNVWKEKNDIKAKKKWKEVYIKK